MLQWQKDKRHHIQESIQERLRSTNKKNTLPMAAVITPMGNSLLATQERANTSTQTMNTPPNSTQANNTYCW